MRLDPENAPVVCLENYGKGPALRLYGEYQSRSSSAGGEILVRQTEGLPDVLPVAQTAQTALKLPADVTNLLPANGWEDGFLGLRLVYEDARRNLYVYKLSMTVIATDGRWYIQENKEQLWRIPPNDRSYIFDNTKSIVEHGRRPLFARSLGHSLGQSE